MRKFSTYGEAVTHAQQQADLHEIETRHKVSRGGAYGENRFWLCGVCDVGGTVSGSTYVEVEEG